MRIITGKLKGRKIPVPKSGEVRPTSDRTKEAIFSVITSRRFLEGSRGLDLFAGSGNLGFEAISRGIEHVLFVDQNRNFLLQIDRLAREFEVHHQVSTLLQPVERFLRNHPTPYDLVFCDPPYDYPFMEEMVAQILTDGWLAPGGWLILEHDRRIDFSDHPHCFYSRAHGRTIVSIFQDQPIDSSEER